MSKCSWPLTCGDSAVSGDSLGDRNLITFKFILGNFRMFVDKTTQRRFVSSSFERPTICNCFFLFWTVDQMMFWLFFFFKLHLVRPEIKILAFILYTSVRLMSDNFLLRFCLMQLKKNLSPSLVHVTHSCKRLHNIIKVLKALKFKHCSCSLLNTGFEFKLWEMFRDMPVTR